MKDKRIKLSRELMFLLAMLVMPFAITLCTKADLGMSMIAAPAYILNESGLLHPLTYGQIEMVFQALVLVVMCIIVRKFRWSYLTSFATAVLYGWILDFYIWLMRDVVITALWLRVVLFASGIVLTAFGVALFLSTYLAPCAYDYLVRTVVEVRHFPLKRVKLINDFVYLGLSVVLTLVIFHGFVGVTIGTFIIAAVNGFLISSMTNFINKHVDLFNHFPKLAAKF